MFIKRDIEELIKSCAEEFVCITIYGARQVGKSTTIDMVFEEKLH